jgi:deferrochelatase/peroxidase EfeB
VFLRSAGLTGAGAGLGFGTERLISDARDAPARREVVPFFGDHQAGIATATQEHLQFEAFDIITDSRAGLQWLLREWSRAAAL